MPRPSRVFQQALYDYYLLLSRGYPWRQARALVAARHGLTRATQVLLTRCIPAPPTLAREVRRKLQTPDAARGKCIVVDAYNQMTTITALLLGHPLYRCLDGLTRDALLAGAKLATKHAEEAAAMLAWALQEINPSTVILVFDSQPSHSRETAKKTASILEEALPTARIEYHVEPKADKTIIEKATRRRCIAASSDTVVALNTPQLLDLAGHTATLAARNSEATITNIPRLLEEEHRSWCSSGGPVA